MEHSNKNNIVLIERIFSKYLIIKLRLNNVVALEKLNGKVIETSPPASQEIAFIKYVDNILNHLSLAARKILISIYIDKLNYNQLPYSSSNFYFKKRKAVQEFVNCIF